MKYEELVQAIKTGNRELYTVSNDQYNNVCSVCSGTGWEFVRVPAPIYGENETVNAVRRCTACNGCHAQNVLDIKTRACIPSARSLSDFDWSLYENADYTREKKIVEAFIEHFPEFERDNTGLYITSKTRGSGKTFLASAIAGELIDKYEASIQFINVSDLLEMSKRKSDDGADPLEKLLSCRVLILDDLGQKLTGINWLEDILFRIVNTRYSTKKTLVVTSNIPLPELDFDDRLVDRLNAMMLTVKIPECCIRAIETLSRKEKILRKYGIE